MILIRPDRDWFLRLAAALLMLSLVGSALAMAEDAPAVAEVSPAEESAAEGGTTDAPPLSDPSAYPPNFERLESLVGQTPAAEPATTREKLREALLTEEFRYDPKFLLDPFAPFTVKEELASPEFQLPSGEVAREPPKPQLPLTRLQKMGLGEVESGLKAILMGPMGRRALVQDGSGKGYILEVGTPVTGSDGVVTEIFEDAIVIRQQLWDRNLKKYVPKETLIRLKTADQVAAPR